MASTQNLFENIITWAKNDQASPILPVLGLTAGALSTALRRNSIPKEKFKRDLVRNIILGGLAGAGAEVARAGVGRAMKHYWEPAAIPEDTAGLLLPKPLHGYPRVEV